MNQNQLSPMTPLDKTKDNATIWVKGISKFEPQNRTGEGVQLSMLLTPERVADLYNYVVARCTATGRNGTIIKFTQSLKDTAGNNIPFAYLPRLTMPGNVAAAQAPAPQYVPQAPPVAQVPAYVPPAPVAAPGITMDQVNTQLDAKLGAFAADLLSQISKAQAPAEEKTEEPIVSEETTEVPAASDAPENFEQPE